MKAEIKEVAPCRKSVNIELTVEEIDTAYKSAYGSLLNEAQLPGFRKGHVPQNLLERKFGAEITEEVKHQLVGEHLDKALKDNKLSPLGEPTVDLGSIKLARNAPLSFVVEIDVRPDFTLSSYKGLSLKRKSAAASDTQINEALENLRQRFADYNATQDAAAAGDMVEGTIALNAEGTELYRQEKQRVPLEGDSIFGMETGDVTKVLAGAKAGSKKEFKFTLPATFHREDMRGKEAVLSVEVAEVRKRSLLDDTALAGRLGMQDVEALKKMLGERIEAEAKQASQAELEKQLVDNLITANPFPLPEGVLSRQKEMSIARMKQRFIMMGATPEQMESQGAEMEKAGAEAAERDIRWMVIMGAIAEAEKIELTPADIQENINRLAKHYRTTPEKVVRQIRDRNGLGAMEAEILDVKVTKMLLDSATIEDVPADAKA